MASSVFIRLADGRVVPLSESEQTLSAQELKAHLEQWLRNGQRITVATGNGHVEEITPTSVRVIEIVRKPT